jgi:hypothetical protein
MPPIPETIVGVTLALAVKPKTTISDYLLAINEQVHDSKQKHNKAQQFSIAFLEFALANMDNAAMTKALLQRRLQFETDSVLTNYETATYFLANNSVYSNLTDQEREKALLAHVKEVASRNQLTVTAIIQHTPSNSRNRRSGGGGGYSGRNNSGGGGDNNSRPSGGYGGGGGGGGSGDSNNGNGNGQQHHRNGNQQQQGGGGPYSNQNGQQSNNFRAPTTPHTTRGGSTFNGGGR